MRLGRDGADQARTPIPLHFEIDGARSEVTVDMEKSPFELKDYRIPLESKQPRSWGKVTIPSGLGAIERLVLYGNDGAWTQQIRGPYGLYISAGTQFLQCYNGNFGLVFEVNAAGDGQWANNSFGGIGSGNASFISNGPWGNWAIHANGQTHGIRAVGTSVAVQCVGRFEQSGGNSELNGLLQVNGGMGGSAWSLSVYNANQTTACFGVRDDGRIWIPNIGTSASATGSLFRSSANQLIYELTSSGRYKRDIRSIARQQARRVVAQLRAVSFKSKCPDDDPNLTHYGMIAEEVAAVDPSLATFDNDGRPKSVNYDRIGMLLLPLVQEILGMNEPEGTW